jgi:hypothetical protein
MAESKPEPSIIKTAALVELCSSEKKGMSKLLGILDPQQLIKILKG